MDFEKMARRLAGNQPETAAADPLLEAAAAALKSLGKSMDLGGSVTPVKNGVQVDVKGGGKLTLTLT